MSTNNPLSQGKFDQMEETIHKIKQHAQSKKDWKLWGMADNLGFLLRDFTCALIIEGTIPDPSITKAPEGQDGRTTLR